MAGFRAKKIEKGRRLPRQYFKLMIDLPLQLQMVMCRRLEGSGKGYYTTYQINGSVRKHFDWYGLYE